MEKTIRVKHPLGYAVYTEQELQEELSDLDFLRDAFLVLLNNKLTDESWDFPYNKEEVLSLAKEMYKKCNYSNDFIEECFKNELSKNNSQQ